MDEQVTIKMATQLYRATSALLATLESISQEEMRGIISKPDGKMSIASAVASGDERATELATDLQTNLFPPLPVQATITGAILTLQHSGDMTTEEYLGISNQLLKNIPDNIQTIVSLSQDEAIAASFKGTLLIAWELLAADE